VQYLDDLDIAALGFAVVGGLGERGPTLRCLGVDIGAGGDQYLHRCDVTAMGRVHQCGLTGFVGCGMAGAGIQQIFD